MFLTVSDSPPHVRRVRLCPPSIQLRKVQSAVDKNLHAARAAGLPGTAWRIDPKIDTLHQLLCQQHVVIAQEHNASADLRASDEIIPLLDQRLTGSILGMRFARQHQLDWPLPVSEKTHQPVGILQEQIGTLISGKPARESQCQRVLIENMGGLPWGPEFSRQLTRVSFAHLIYQCLSCCSAHLPQLRAADSANIILRRTVAPPALFAACAGPQRIRLLRIPCRHVYAVGN